MGKLDRERQWWLTSQLNDAQVLSPARSLIATKSHTRQRVVLSSPFYNSVPRLTAPPIHTRQRVVLQILSPGPA
jgi:hypothetical protein